MKYKFTGKTKVVFGVTLKQIVCVTSFASVLVGDIGGWIQSERNLSQNGNAWVYGDAEVYGDARVYGDAEVCGGAWVYGDARVCGNARVCGDAEVLWISKIGSENGTLTVCRAKGKGLFISRGCFYGSLDDFERAVSDTHSDNKTAKEYKLIIEMIKIRFDEWI